MLNSWLGGGGETHGRGGEREKKKSNWWTERVLGWSNSYYVYITPTKGKGLNTKYQNLLTIFPLINNSVQWGRIIRTKPVMFAFMSNVCEVWSFSCALDLTWFPRLNIPAVCITQSSPKDQSLVHTLVSLMTRGHIWCVHEVMLYV